MRVGAETIRRCGNDPDAIEAVYRAYRGRVWAYAIRRARDPHEAADLVAEVFLAVVDSASSFDPERGSPVGWLLGIASRRLADMRRQQAREGRALALLNSRSRLPSDEWEKISERIDAERAATRLLGAVDELPEAEREVLSLIARDELSPTEAAQVLGITATAARMRLSRARRRLKSAAAAAATTADSQSALRQDGAPR